jgi:hypothetical protein
LDPFNSVLYGGLQLGREVAVLDEVEEIGLAHFAGDFHHPSQLGADIAGAHPFGDEPGFGGGVADRAGRDSRRGPKRRSWCCEICPRRPPTWGTFDQG